MDEDRTCAICHLVFDTEADCLAHFDLCEAVYDLAVGDAEFDMAELEV